MVLSHVIRSEIVRHIHCEDIPTIAKFVSIRLSILRIIKKTHHLAIKPWFYIWPLPVLISYGALLS